MVVARDGFALWGRASKEAYKSGILIPSGMPIPDGSVAARAPQAQNGGRNHPISLPEGVWRFPRTDEPVRELAIFSNSLSQSIPVLLFDDAPAISSAEEPGEWDTYDQFQLWNSQSDPVES